MQERKEIHCTFDGSKFVFESTKAYDLTWLGFRATKQYYKHHGTPTINSLLDLRSNGYSVLYDDSAVGKRNELLAQYQQILDAQRFKTLPDEEIEELCSEIVEKLPADPYQRRAILFALHTKRCLLSLEMGLGKTYIGSTLVQHLKDTGAVKKTLLLAPLSLHLKQNWPDEIVKFSDLSFLSLRDESNLGEKADVYILNPDKLRSYCLTDEKRYLYGNALEKMNFDCILFDESTKLKTYNSQTTQIFHKLAANIPYVYLMSGLPAPNDVFQLWGQMTALGSWLGDSFGSMQQRYGREIKINAAVTKWLPKPGAIDQIKQRVEPVVIHMTQAQYLPLPEYHNQEIYVDMPKELMDIYEQVEEEYYVVLDEKNSEDPEVRRMYVEHEVAVRAKLMQILNGFLILQDDKGEKSVQRLLWNPKLDRLRTLLAPILTDPKNSVIIWTRFREELSWIYEELGRSYTVAYGRGGMSDKEKQGQLDLWLNDEKCQIIVAHPAAFMYGHTWNKAAYTVYTSATDDHEHYAQSRRRNYRRGQTKEVTEFKIITRGTLEQRIWMAVEHKKRLDQILKQR